MRKMVGFDFWTNPADPTGQIGEWSEALAAEADSGNVHIDNIPVAYGGDTPSPVSFASLWKFWVNPGDPTGDIQKWRDIVAEEAEGGDLNVNKVPAAYGGTPGIFSYWLNPGDPTGQIREWWEKIAKEGDTKPDYDLSLLLPWNWTREVYKKLLADEEAKKDGSLPLATSGAIKGAAKQTGEAAKGAADFLKSAADPENPFKWLLTDTGLMVSGAVGLVLLIMIIK